MSKEWLKRNERTDKPTFNAYEWLILVIGALLLGGMIVGLFV